ncbi:MAG: twin-arginine translocase subunit TatC [Verrucomicrobiota bacterium]|nr:twin-arginine translocase subunit TatC [Verrucomicrobiota bacterium]
MSDSNEEQEVTSTRISSLRRFRGEEMTFMEHLEELRGTLVKCSIAYLVACGILTYFLKEVAQWLNWPMKEAMRLAGGATEQALILTSPMGVFSVSIQLILMGGLVLSMPFLIFFFSQFVAPALNERELRVLRPTGLAILGLFLVGCGFSFFILVPGALAAAIKLADLYEFKNLWAADYYYSLLTWMTVGVGLTFEFPLVLLLLVKIGVLTGKKLISWWRHSAVFFLIFSAIITPTADPVTFLLLAIPLFILYLIAAIVAMGMDKKKAEAAADEDAL